MSKERSKTVHRKWHEKSVGYGGLKRV